MKTPIMSAAIMSCTPSFSILVLVAALASLTACSKPDANAAAGASAAPPPPEVIVMVAQRQPVERSIELSGRLRAYQIADFNGYKHQALFKNACLRKVLLC